MMSRVMVKIVKAVPGKDWAEGSEHSFAESDAAELIKGGFAKLLADEGKTVVKVLHRIPRHGYNPGEILDLPKKLADEFVERGLCAVFDPSAPQATAAAPAVEDGDKGAKKTKGDKGAKKTSES